MWTTLYYIASCFVLHVRLQRSSGLDLHSELHCSGILQIANAKDEGELEMGQLRWSFCRRVSIAP
jgi:hypothetical protein